MCRDKGVPGNNTTLSGNRGSSELKRSPIGGVHIVPVLQLYASVGSTT